MIILQVGLDSHKLYKPFYFHNCLMLFFFNFYFCYFSTDCSVPSLLIVLRSEPKPLYISSTHSSTEPNLQADLNCFLII